MSHYLHQIEQLVALQKIDDLIYTVKQRIKNAPDKIKLLQADFEDCERRKVHIEEKLQHLYEQEKRILNELEENADRMKKSKEKLTQVENEREYSAVSREMDTVEKQNRTRTDEQHVVSDEISTQKVYLAEVMLDWESLRVQVEEAQESFDSITKEADIELAKYNESRVESVKVIPVPVLSRYEFIRKRLEHPVIVSVRKGVCTGCNIAIPPQAYNELQRGQQILSCPNCQRLIFWEEHFIKEEAPENEQKAEDTE